MKNLLFVYSALLLFFPMNLLAQNQKIKVWPDGAPSENGLAPEQERSGKFGEIYDISEAELHIYPLKNKKNAPAVLILPGGGYRFVSMKYEGKAIAEVFNRAGYAAFVLKYRLPEQRPEVPVQDAARAMRLIRSGAQKYGLDPAKVGVIGFSAGGHLAAMLSVRAVEAQPGLAENLLRFSARPDFSILVYPVISMQEPVMHQGSWKRLLGKTATPENRKLFSADLQVNSRTPPAYLVHARDDSGVSPENSERYYAALQKQNIPAKLRLYDKGGHGFGLRKRGIPADNWLNEALEWLRGSGF